MDEHDENRSSAMPPRGGIEMDESYELAKKMHEAIGRAYAQGFGDPSYSVIPWDELPPLMRQGLVVGANFYLEDQSK